MLLYLAISNFALIKEVEVELEQGLNILTGETGAGKSMVIDALDMLLGGRASTDYIRDGEEKAVIEASFAIADNKSVKKVLSDMGFETEHGNVVLTRELNLSGNNKSRINGRIVTLDMTREVSKYLIDIHGQHEHQSLLDSSNHLNLVDDYGGEDLKQVKNEVKDIYRGFKEKRDKLKAIKDNAVEREKRIDLLEFQVNEIDEAELNSEEDEELFAEKKRLNNAEKISGAVANAYKIIYESDMHKDAIIDELGTVNKDLESLINIDEGLEEIYQSIKNIIYEIEDVAVRLNDYSEEIEYNPQRLKIIEERLNLINDLKRKYGDSIEKILNYYQKGKDELRKLKDEQDNIEVLETEVQEFKEKYLDKAKKLSQKRQNIAEKLEREAMSQLRDLAMNEIRFKVDFSKKDKLSATGIDTVEFLISPNPGSELRPLQKTASGGELSRIMLALKIITADIDETATLVFDEVDSGIGGRTARLVANKLAVLSKKYQLICITHLPQIAALADGHNLIRKKVNKGVTKTKLRKLNRKDRIREIARMLDGSLNSTTLEHAEKLIDSGKRKKGTVSRN